MTHVPARLLVIDDESEVIDLVRMVASDFGFDVTALKSVEGMTEGVLVGFDIVVLDLMMPNTDGIEFLRQFAGLKHLPRFVLMSGLDRRTLDSARLLAETKGIEVIAILRKPFRPSELRAIFDEHSGSAAARPVAAPRQAPPRFTLPEIADGIARGELAIHFQPQLSLADGRWCGVEALVRWQHPVHGLLHPDAFVETVENSGLALPFTEAVIRHAIAGVKVLARTAGFEGRLSANMPPSALTELAFPERLDSLLEELEFDRKRFCLEITETSIPPNLETSRDILTRLSMRGVRLAIDDFGTGHSGLERLHRSPFEELKIDIAFVRDADQDPAARAITQNAIALGHSLGMEVVAEGVETAQTLAWLTSLGCDIAQGFFICRPQPAEALAEWARATPLLAKARASVPNRAAEPEPLPTSSREMRPTVLVVEDNVANQQMYAEYLSSNGLDVSTADNGQEAVLMASTHDYALIIMDGQMPLMGGIEATRRIRGLGPKQRDVPIIALTALAGADDRRRFEEAGADVFLNKPVRLKEILEAAHRLLGRAE